MPFIRKVRVLCKTRLIFPRINGPNDTRDYTNRTPATRSSKFVNHSYDYRPNWTPLSPVTIIDSYKKNIEDLAVAYGSRSLTIEPQAGLFRDSFTT